MKMIKILEINRTHIIKIIEHKFKCKFDDVKLSSKGFKGIINKQEVNLQNGRKERS